MLETIALASLSEMLWKGITNSKAGKVIIGDFQDGIQNEIIGFWERIKPKFLREDPEIVKDIEAEPEDEDNQAAFKRRIKKMVAKDGELSSNMNDFLQEIVKKAEDLNDASISHIVGNHNINIQNASHTTISINIDKP